MKLLFVDCCMKEGDASTTRLLCRTFLTEFIKASPDCELETLVLKDTGLTPLLQADIERRDVLLRAGDTSHAMFALARQFASADRILIGAPYWDLSFPSLLKVYIEHIFVNGVVFAYEGPTVVSRCRAEKLMYLQSAGGFIPEEEPGGVYWKAICDTLGIRSYRRICAQGMDVREIDREAQWRGAVEQTILAAREW